MDLIQTARMLELGNKGETALREMGKTKTELLKIITDKNVATGSELPTLTVDQIASLVYKKAREMESEIHLEEAIGVAKDAEQRLCDAKNSGLVNGWIGTAFGALVTTIGFLGWDPFILLYEYFTSI